MQRIGVKWHAPPPARHSPNLPHQSFNPWTNLACKSGPMTRLTALLAAVPTKALAITVEVTYCCKKALTTAKDGSTNSANNPVTRETYNGAIQSVTTTLAVGNYQQKYQLTMPLAVPTASRANKNTR